MFILNNIIHKLYTVEILSMKNLNYSNHSLFVNRKNMESIPVDLMNKSSEKVILLNMKTYDRYLFLFYSKSKLNNVEKIDR